MAATTTTSSSTADVIAPAAPPAPAVALRLCGRFLANREDAEEACQDTLWAVARGIGNFHGRSTFRAAARAAA